jgi:hypothetical protein
VVSHVSHTAGVSQCAAVHTTLTRTRTRTRRYEHFSFIDDPDRRANHAIVAFMDEAVGNVTRALRANGDMWASTLLVWSSDNGGAVHLGGGANSFPLRGGYFNNWFVFPPFSAHLFVFCRSRRATGLPEEYGRQVGFHRRLSTRREGTLLGGMSWVGMCGGWACVEGGRVWRVGVCGGGSASAVGVSLLWEGNSTDPLCSRCTGKGAPESRRWPMAASCRRPRVVPSCPSPSTRRTGMPPSAFLQAWTRPTRAPPPPRRRCLPSTRSTSGRSSSRPAQAQAVLPARARSGP